MEKWISMEDKLPEYDESVLLFIRRVNFELESYIDFGYHSHTNKDGEYFKSINNSRGYLLSDDSDRPSHWMRLPKPPKID